MSFESCNEPFSVVSESREQVYDLFPCCLSLSRALEVSLFPSSIRVFHFCTGLQHPVATHATGEWIVSLETRYQSLWIRVWLRRVTYLVANKDACSVLYPDCMLFLSFSFYICVYSYEYARQFYAFGARLEDIFPLVTRSVDAQEIYDV